VGLFFVAMTRTGRLKVINDHPQCVFTALVLLVYHDSCCVVWLLGRSFAATTTEGLLVYSLDENVMFDPFELDVTVTPDRVREAVSEQQYLTAVMLALRLNEPSLVCHAVQHVPHPHSMHSVTSHYSASK